MPITVDCACGKSYRLKDEMSGKLVECPACRQVLRVEPLATVAQADPIFDRDKFLLHQKVLSVSAKYHVWDEQGQVILFVERPIFLLRSIAMVFAALGTAIVGGLVVALTVFAVSALSEAAAAIVGAIGGVGVLLAMIAVMIWVSPKRHVHFYRDESRADQVLQVQQDKKFMLFVATYTVLDEHHHPLARFRKNYLYNILRKRWQVYTPEGNLLCMALEDSIILSMLRRLIGPMMGILRTNFVLVEPDGEQILGEFNRKFTLLDRYVLDLTRDPTRSLDRRVAIALGVMLDTGERR